MKEVGNYLEDIPKEMTIEFDRLRELRKAHGKAFARRRMNRIESRIAMLENMDAALRLAIQSVEDLVEQKAGNLAEALRLLQVKGLDVFRNADGADPELVKLEDTEFRKLAEGYARQTAELRERLAKFRQSARN